MKPRPQASEPPNPSRSIRTLGFLVKELATGEREFLLSRHVKQGKWNGFGGKVGDKPEFQAESIENALCREASEEFGIKISAWQKRAQILFDFQGEDNLRTQVLCHVFFVYKFDGILMQSAEMQEPTWFKVEDLPWEEMWPNDKIWLEPLLKNEKFLTAEFYFTPDHGLMASQSVMKWKKLS